MTSCLHWHLITAIIKLQYSSFTSPSCSSLSLSVIEAANKAPDNKTKAVIELKFYALLCFDSSPIEWERLLRFSRRSIILEGQYRTKSPGTASRPISHSLCRGRRYRSPLIDPNQLPDKYQNIWENWVTRRVPSLQTNHYPLVSASLINEPPPALSAFCRKTWKRSSSRKRLFGTRSEPARPRAAPARLAARSGARRSAEVFNPPFICPAWMRSGVKSGGVSTSF